MPSRHLVHGHRSQYIHAMESPDFYLTLPSNASMNTHPDNTLTHYITTLPQPLTLSGQWECCLVETLYPHSWYKVREEDAWFGIGLRNTDETEEFTTTRTRIEAGYYQGPKTLVKTINKSLLRALPANVVRLSYSVIMHKMTLTMLSNVVFLGDMNTTILGFRDNPLIGPNDGTDIVREADSVVDMSRGFESLYFTRTLLNPVSSATASCRWGWETFSETFYEARCLSSKEAP